MYILEGKQIGVIFSDSETAKNKPEMNVCHYDVIIAMHVTARDRAIVRRQMHCTRNLVVAKDASEYLNSNFLLNYERYFRNSLYNTHPARLLFTN